MAGPPKDVEVSELWSRLSQRPRPWREVPFPSRDPDKSPGPMVLVLLTQQELQESRARAAKAARDMLGSEAGAAELAYQDVYHDEMALELLWHSCRDAKDHTKYVFPGPKAVRKALYTDEIAVLVRTYHYFRLEAGPILSEMSVPEMEAWIRVLQEGGSRVPLASCSGEALTDLVMFLVSKLATSPTASGSAGSPQGEPSTEGAPPPAEERDGEVQPREG